MTGTRSTDRATRGGAPASGTRITIFAQPTRG